MTWTDIGFSCIRNWMIGTSPSTYPTLMAAGTGSTAAAFSDTVLGSKILNTEHGFTYTLVKEKQVEWEHVVGSGDASGLTLAEVGMFNTGSNMFWRDTFVGITQTGSVQIQTVLTTNII